MLDYPLFDNPDIEKTVLGIMMYDLPLAKLYAPLLNDKMFYDPHAGRLFKVLIAVIKQHPDAKQVYTDNFDTVLIAAYSACKIEWTDEERSYAWECFHSFGNTHPSVFDGLCRCIFDNARARTVAKIVVKAQTETDPVKYVETLSQAVSLVALQEYRRTATSTPKACLDASQELLDKQRGIFKFEGVPTGFDAIDSIIGRMPRKEVTIIAGRPGHGKTSLACQVADNAVQSEYSVLYISLEMMADKLIKKIASQQTNTPIQSIEEGSLNTNQLGAVTNYYEKIAKTHTINDSVLPDKDKVLSAIRFHLLKKRFDLVIVDQITTIQMQGYMKRHQQVGMILKGLLAIAKEFNLSMLVLAQLSRNDKEKNRPPRMSDLKESGNLEEDSALLLFTYRPGLVDVTDNVGPGSMLLIPKNRYGATGFVPGFFNGECTRFSFYKKKKEGEKDGRNEG